MTDYFPAQYLEPSCFIRIFISRLRERGSHQETDLPPREHRGTALCPHHYFLFLAESLHGAPVKRLPLPCPCNEKERRVTLDIREKKAVAN
ncbi:hypothetical protein NDU88_003612 [Pleurodeles waltl]|uniref:Uncharacterized protein n=1 Tax=Pleurodeles waltl TaxID=8319 RepID=A0AAV7UZF7_PLEWA|nr:hypothetical protein NDU88_003612 [Pleurodeles waltl]